MGLDWDRQRLKVRNEMTDNHKKIFNVAGSQADVNLKQCGEILSPTLYTSLIGKNWNPTTQKVGKNVGNWGLHSAAKSEKLLKSTLENKWHFL